MRQISFKVMGRYPPLERSTLTSLGLSVLQDRSQAKLFRAVRQVTVVGKHVKLFACVSRVTRDTNFAISQGSRVNRFWLSTRSTRLVRLPIVLGIAVILLSLKSRTYER